MGPKCPYYLDPSRNDVTGREIKDKATIEYIVKLHNEVRSKIARGWCDQPKAGCMGPVVSVVFDIGVFEDVNYLLGNSNSYQLGIIPIWHSLSVVNIQWKMVTCSV